MSTTVKTLLAEAETKLSEQGINTPRLDAETLLAHILATDRAHLFSRLSSPVVQSDQEAFQCLLERRARREPLAYITGAREFWSLDFRVTPDVLIPRPETEVVVETVLRLISRSSIPNPQSPIRLLDVGTGSGCLVITLAKELPTAELWAVDVSHAALATARANAQRHGVEQRIHFLQGDLFSPLKKDAPGFDIHCFQPALHRTCRPCRSPAGSS